MILVDTSVWIDHVRTPDARLIYFLEQEEIAQHPMVTGELALGSIASRARFLRFLGRLPEPELATLDEVRELIERARLYARGIGLVDVHLLASTLLTPGARLWTNDRRLQAAAEELGIAAD